MLHLSREAAERHCERDDADYKKGCGQNAYSDRRPVRVARAHAQVIRAAKRLAKRGAKVNGTPDPVSAAAHVHVCTSTTVRAFCGPVSRDENPCAHGNVCVVERCACGATRESNVNQRHVETGAWHIG